VRRDHVSRGDQEYVARLRRAGFVILGKTSTPEFGMQAHHRRLERRVRGRMMGQFGGEALCLRLAAQLEQARPWADAWPPVSEPP